MSDLVDGRIDVAWNSPLAWVRARRLAAARGVSLTPVTMRDTDCDLRSVVVVRADSPVASLADLAGPGGGDRSDGLAAGHPAAAVAAAVGRALSGDRRDGRRFDIGVGLHGDHIGGEREAARALFAADPADRVDAACMIDSNLLLFGREGVLPVGAVRVLAQTSPYDHCTMTAGPSACDAAADATAAAAAAATAADVGRFGELLLGMDYADASLRPLLDLEGLKEWRPPRLSGYGQLERAVDEAGFYDCDGAITADGYRP